MRRPLCGLQWSLSTWGNSLWVTVQVPIPSPKIYSSPESDRWREIRGKELDKTEKNTEEKNIEIRKTEAVEIGENETNPILLQEAKGYCSKATTMNTA